MTQERDLDRVLTVSAGDVSVEKSFEPESFPVPAIAFTISSEREEPVQIRLVDTIPEEFPMSAIGFHPDYESENWTAYKDHRVEFERTIDPDETVETVYGVRLDREEDAAQFLTEPTLEEVGEEELGEQVEDVLGEDRNQPVRDVLAGDREALPGDDASTDTGGVEPEPDTGEADPLDLGDPAENAESDAGAEARGAEAESKPASNSGPRDLDGDLTPAVVERPPEAEPLGVTERGLREGAVEDAAEGEGSTHEEAIPETPGAVDLDEAETHEAPVAVEGDAAAEAEAAEATGEHGPDDATAGDLTAVAGGGVAAALATEIREGRVDDDDLETLREEIDLGVPRSVTVRMKRLQSNVADLDAYTDALEEFIDEEGTAEELIEGFQSDLEAVEETIGALEADIDEATAERAALSDTVDELEEDIASLEESVGETTSRLETVSSDLSAAETRLTGLDEEIGEVREEVADLDTGVADLEDEIADVDERVESELDAVREETSERVEAVRADLTDEVETLASELEDVRAELDEFEQFRERLGQAFGGLGGTGDDGNTGGDANEIEDAGGDPSDGDQ